MPIKPLSFKGDKKPHKKRKRDPDDESAKPRSTDLTTTSNAPDGHTPEDDDSWVSCDLPSDLSGPALLVLPTTPPTALASDPHGNIFASPLENVVEDDPATAEPHDVRQVWIATRIAGTGEGQVNFKGAHGKYLGCDTYGILTAKREAIGREEAFTVIIAEESATGQGSVAGMFAVKTAASKEEGKEMFVCARGGDDDDDGGGAKKKAVEVRGDGDGLSYSTTLRVRMQARFKPRLKANKEMKAKEKISRRELEAAVGRKLDDEEVKRLKKARRDGTYHEEVLDVRVKGKHDKFAS
jgi:protein FRG1